MKASLLLMGVLAAVLAVPVLADDVPTRGMSMRQVEKHFGAPQHRYSPVGHPPISRWRYAGFTVYFDHSTVVNTVLDGAPAAAPVLDQTPPVQGTAPAPVDAFKPIPVMKPTEKQASDSATGSN